MTAQVGDSILIHDRAYDVCGIHGGPLFEPESLGLVPIPPHSACWRGHVDQYRIFRRRLVLERLHVWLGGSSAEPNGRGASQRGPAINGAAPQVTPITDDMSENFYDALRLELPFTGGILAGRGFFRDLYVHMGFPPAWKFKQVYEAIFERGRLKELRDVSPQMADIRARMLERPLKPDLRDARSGELTAWIASTFRLDYDWDSWM